MRYIAHKPMWIDVALWIVVIAFPHLITGAAWKALMALACLACWMVVVRPTWHGLFKPFATLTLVIQAVVLSGLMISR